MERDEIGFKVYVESMAKSTDDKTKQIMPLVEKSIRSIKGDILDMGGGTGDLGLVLFDSALKFNAGLTILDADKRMIDILADKFKGCPQVSLVSCDALGMNLDKKFSTVVCSSFLHEIFSIKGKMSDIKTLLKCVRSCLLPGGSLIIRDGIKPRPSKEKIYLKPSDQKISELWRRFAASYSYWKNPPRPTQIGEKNLIAATAEMVYEFAVKYQYEINWRAEMKEQFGFWTETEARKILKGAGFEIVYLKKYLLDYFKQLFSEDFELFKRDKGKLVKIDYFNTHMVIAAKRI